jgi:hypothetical protein
MKHKSDTNSLRNSLPILGESVSSGDRAAEIHQKGLR